MTDNIELHEPTLRAAMEALAEHGYGSSASVLRALFPEPVSRAERVTKEYIATRGEISKNDEWCVEHFAHWLEANPDKLPQPEPRKVRGPYDFSPEWCKKMAELEGDHEIGAGSLAMDPECVAEGTKDRRPLFDVGTMVVERNYPYRVGKVTPAKGPTNCAVDFGGGVIVEHVGAAQECLKIAPAVPQPERKAVSEEEIEREAREIWSGHAFQPLKLLCAAIERGIALAHTKATEDEIADAEKRGMLKVVEWLEYNDWYAAAGLIRRHFGLGEK